MEIKRIEGTNYSISDNGDVYHLELGGLVRKLDKKLNKDGKYAFAYQSKDKIKYTNVDTMVIRMFRPSDVEEGRKRIYVQHLDGDELNCNLSNLKVINNPNHRFAKNELIKSLRYDNDLLRRGWQMLSKEYDAQKEKLERNEKYIKQLEILNNVKYDNAFEKIFNKRKAYEFAERLSTIVEENKK